MSRAETDNLSDAGRADPPGPEQGDHPLRYQPEVDGREPTAGAPRSVAEITVRALRLATVVFSVAGAVVLLWSASNPHGSFFHLMAGLGLWGLAGLGWLIGAGIVGFESMQGRSTPPWGWLVVTATIVFTTFGIRMVDAPLELRFAHSRDAFEEIVAEAHPDLTPEQMIGMDVDINGRVGTYEVTDVRQQGDAVLFTVPGGFIDDVGFAYLPSGPFPDLSTTMEEPTFRRVSGDWYVWSAGW